MAEEDKFGFRGFFGEEAIKPDVPSPEEAIGQYDEQMTKKTMSFDDLLSGVNMKPQLDPATESYYRGAAAADIQDDTFAASDRIRFGDAPQQQFMDPAALISSPGQNVARGLAAGVGDLAVGTGDALNYVNARLFPKETDGTTPMGDYFKKIGTELQQENLVVLSEDLKDFNWDDLFKPEFWTSKASRLAPYSASFVIPYTAGTRFGNLILKGAFKYGQGTLRGLQTSGTLGTMSKGATLLKAGKKGKKGSGALQYLGVDAGKKGIAPTKLARNVSGFIGGGITANRAEGLYLAGETYQEMINDIDEDTGQPRFTPEEAAQSAAGVIKDNFYYAGVDALQYGILFGGAGRGLMGRILRAPVTKTNIKNASRPLVSSLLRKAAPNLTAVGAYAGVEGVTEGVQEVYQEWIKYKAIEEAKGKDYKTMTQWVKNADGIKPEIRDIFWSSVGMGGAAGGIRGYFDGVAERQAMLDKKNDGYTNAIDMIKEAAANQNADQRMVMQNAVDNLLANEIWFYEGDGSVAMSIVDNLVSDGKISEENGLEYKTKIEQAEKNYEKHHVNSTLTQAGAEQAFYIEMRKSRKEGEIADEIEQHEERMQNQKNIIKSDKTKLDKKLALLEDEHNKTLERLQNELKAEELRLENLYTAEIDKAPTAKATGQRDKRFKEKGLKKGDFEAFTQEGAKQKETREAAEVEAKAQEEAAKPKPTITERVTEVGTKALQAAKDLGTAAVAGVKGVVDRVRKPAEAPAKTIEDVNNIANITSTAKEKLVQAVENEELTPEQATNIKGSGRGGTINTRDVNTAIRKAKAEKTETSQEDVKKKEQPRVVPKTKSYKSTEESLEKGPRVLSKPSVEKGQGANYTVKTEDGETIRYRDFEGKSDKYIFEDNVNVQLKLKKPVAGQENVVEENGKLFFEFNDLLYESEIEVVINDEVVGKLAQRDFKAEKTTVKAKKKDQRKIDQIVKGIKDTKNNILKYFTKTQKELDGFEPTQLNISPEYQYGSGVIMSSYIREIVNKKFPGAKGVLVYNKLFDDYGQEATSLAIGSTVFINADSVLQGDIVHEAGHIYYGMMEDTPLMKRIKKLLPKTSLYNRTKQDYPELILLKYKNKTLTLGEFYRNIINNSDINSDNDLVSIANNISQAIKIKDNAKINDLFLSLRTQLKAKGAKDIKDSQQKHILEETFTRTLEAYSNGNPDTVIEGSAAQKKLEQDLISFYKEVKGITNDEDAREILNLSVKDIASLDLENAIKAVLLNFRSERSTMPKMRNSAYGAISRASKKQLVKNSSFSAVSFYISENIGEGRNADQVTDLVMKSIADDSNLTVQDADIESIRAGVKAAILQTTRPQDIAKADSVLDKDLKAIGVDLRKKEDVEGESEIQNDINNIEEKDIGLPSTTSLFVRKIVEVYNNGVEENGRIDAKKVLAPLMQLAKQTKENPFDFPQEVRKSKNDAVLAVVNILDRVYGGDQVLTNAKLLEIKSSLEGITIETLAHNVLTISNEKDRFWTRYESTNVTVEKMVVDNIVSSLENNQEISDQVKEVYDSFFKKKNFSDTAKYKAARTVFERLLSASSKKELINIDAMLNQTMIYKGKRQSVPNILFDHKINKFGNPALDNVIMMVHRGVEKGFEDNFGEKKVLGTFYGKQRDIRTILNHGVIMSRASNYLSMVNDVDMDGVSIFNKENGLRNRADNVERIFNEGVELDKNDIMHQDNNIYSAMALKNSNTEGKKTFNFTVHSGLMRRFVEKASGLQNKDHRTRKFTDVNFNELTITDFFIFLKNYNQGIKDNLPVIRYPQPIAVFADKSRRYYVESIAAHNPKITKLILSKIENNPAYRNKDVYKKSKKLVFPYTIKNGKIAEIKEISKRFTDYLKLNKDLIVNNRDIKNYQDGAVEAFLTSYIANKFMAQQLFVHDHRQSNSEIDYIKRAAGAIASHTVFDRNTTVEFVVTNDYYETKDGEIYTEKEAEETLGKDKWEDETAIENDAMGYVLPEEAEMIRRKYGTTQKVGNVFKFVYHYTQLEGSLKGRTTYMKFAVHTLTPEIEALSPYFKNIAEVLRTRRSQIKDDGSKGGLVIAASQSAAKLYSGGDEVIHDIKDGFDMDKIMAAQDKLYRGDGKYIGLSGEGLGIQLELDKETDERFFPSQLFYNLVTNLSTEDQAIAAGMLEKRKTVMEENKTQRSGALIANDSSTEADVIKERDSFKSSVSSEVYDVLVDNTFDKLDPRYPYLNAIYNSVAIGRITHKGTKMYTKGSIAYQSASLGVGLKFYQKGLYTGPAIEGISNENIVASEAIIPGYMQDQGVKVGDLFIGTRVPAHGKVSSAVFIVKGFHKKIGDTPTSNITIPSWVSKYWGADLDGDSVHMNFKYTQQEVQEKSWRKLSNEFFDSYVALVSKKEKQGEIQNSINFEKAAETAIAKVSKGKEQVSQLEPSGDGQMFADNVPAKNLVGMIASLMRSFNVFSNSQDVLPFAITIKGESGPVTHDKFYDDPSAENNAGNWFGVAQLLNIALDNAKHQYANKLGMDMQSVFPYVLLRRLGYSLNDLAVLFNSPIVKQYMNFKRNDSKEYISKEGDIADLFNEKNNINENQLLKFAKQEKLGKIDIRGFVTAIVTSKTIGTNLGVQIDLSKLNTLKEKRTVVLMLYALDRYKKFAVDPISKAFTVHQTIEKNPLELKKIRDGIKRVTGPFEEGQFTIPMIGKTGFEYTFTEQTKNNFIISHAEDIFKSVLDRAARTDIRYTPYMRKILQNDNAVKKLEDAKELKNEIVNQIIVNNLNNEFKMLKETRDQLTLVKLFEDLKKRETENSFIKNVVEVGERAGKKYIVINRANITEFTSYKAIEQYKEDFGLLSETDQDLMFEIEASFNRYGFTGGAGKATSFVPFFSEEYTAKINDEMSRIIEDNQSRKPDYSSKTLSQELFTAIKDVNERVKGKQNLNTKEQIKQESKSNNNIAIPKLKKVVRPDVSYNNDHLGGDVETLSFDEFVKDKGIDINKIDKDSETLKNLQDQYTVYLNHLDLIRKLEKDFVNKPLSSYTIQGLQDLHRDVSGLHAAASKRVRYDIEKEIGEKAFQEQAKYLRDVGASKGYTYNIPGVDGTPQQDLTNFQAWLGSNNMTSNRPEIQYLINEAQKQYRGYIRSFKKHKRILEEKRTSLIRSKNKGLSILERISSTFDTQARYRFIYGNIASVEDGKVRLLSPEEIVARNVQLTKEEQDYYNTYKALGEILLSSQNDKTTINADQLGKLESISRSGLFGLYSTSIDAQDYYRVRVRGKGKDGKDTIKTFYEWKFDVYKGRTAKLTLDSGRQIFELDKLRRKAKQLKAKGVHEDGKKIMLSDMEYDALVNDGQMMRRLIGSDNITSFDAELIKEYERRKGIKAQNISYDIHNAMLEFMRGHIFYNGEGKFTINDNGDVVQNENRFTGMAELSVLTDAIIGFNKNLDNKNAVKYLTGWWKEGFLGRQQQESAVGKTGDKVIDGFVRLTSLRLLGFNLTVGIGNLLAGKYQELRKRGGKQFILGESRYWRNLKNSQKILRDKRVVEFSFDEFVHLNKQKGLAGKIEQWAYGFMDLSENYIQGASFLGMLTEEEFNNPDSITEERVMSINNKISTLHGEGYTALDASLLSMYSYGRALLQFKKWFVTLFQDRFKAEDIDRFGEVQIGSYRASYEFASNIFKRYFAGEITKKEIIDIFNNSSEQRKKEMRAYASGLGLGVTVLSLIAILEDEDEPDTATIKTLKKFSSDIFVMIDGRRFVNYTIVPASYGTAKNVTRMVGEAVSGDKTQRKSALADKNTSRALKTLQFEVLPYAETRKQFLRLREDLLN